MSYDNLKKLIGKTPISVVEIDLDFCNLTYGVLPCTASTSFPNDKCFNTFNTCPVKNVYSKGTKTYRFSSVRIDELQSTGDAPTFPTLISTDTAPTKLDPAKGLGIRSSVKVKIQDHPYTDVGIDPYLSGRTYNADEQGSFWARFLARNIYWQNRIFRIKQGYLNEDGTYSESNMSSRTYIISNITPPSAKGVVTITAKDVIKLADKENAQIPLASDAVLTGDINNSQTAFVISDPKAKIITAFQAGQQYAIIEDETVYLTNVSAAGGDNYNIVCVRASLPAIYSKQPTAAEHDGGSTIQDCYYYDSQRIDYILNHLLNSVAGIDSQYLDTVQWDEKINEGLQGYQFSRLIIEPTSCKELLDELSMHTITPFWNERTQKVLIDTLFSKEPVNDTILNDTDNIIENSFQTTVDIKGRISQVWVALGLRTPITGDDDLKEYNQVIIRADLDLETANAYDSKSVKTIKSKWMAAGQGSIAIEIASRLLRDYRVAKNIIQITVDPKDDNQWTSDLIQLQTRYIKDTKGNDATLLVKILEAEEILNQKGAKFKYMVQEEARTDLEKVGVITPDTDETGAAFPDYSNASIDQKDTYAFIGYDNTDRFPDGRPRYEIRG